MTDALAHLGRMAGVDASAAARGLLLVCSLLPGRPGWSATVLVVLTLAQAIPGGFPVAALSAALPSDPSAPGGSLVPGLAAAVLTAGAALALARVFRRGPA